MASIIIDIRRWYKKPHKHYNFSMKKLSNEILKNDSGFYSFKTLQGKLIDKAILKVNAHPLKINGDLFSIISFC